MENNGVKYGLLGGLAVVVYSLVLYLIDENMLFGWQAMFGTVIYIACMYKAGMDERADQGGFLSFKEALKPTFLTYVIASLAAVLFTVILYTMIDPSLMDIQRDIAMKQIESMSGILGEEGTEAAIERLEEENILNFRDTSLGYAMSLIFGFAIAAVISAIIKKNRPAFA